MRSWHAHSWHVHSWHAHSWHAHSWHAHSRHVHSCHAHSWHGHSWHVIRAVAVACRRVRPLHSGDKRALMRFLKRVVTQAEAEGTAVFGSRDPDDANRSIGAPGSEWNGGGGDESAGGGASASAGGWGTPGASSGKPVSGSGDSGVCPDPCETFAAALEHHGLSPRLCAAVAYALALRDTDTAAAGPGFEALTQYLASMV